MCASQEAETSPARGHSPRFRWFVLWCVVLYYTLYGVGTFLIPKERSSLEQSALVLGFALLTLALGEPSSTGSTVCRTGWRTRPCFLEGRSRCSASSPSFPEWGWESSVDRPSRPV